MAAIRPDFRRAAKARATATFCLAGALAGTGLYFGNLAYVRGGDEAAAAAAAAVVQEQASAAGNAAVILVGPATTSPKAPLVLGLFRTYFDAVNTHNYAEYSSTLDAKMQAVNPKSSFDSGYATTTDTNEVINSITTHGNGTLTARVSFTSRQDPSDSPDHISCNNWTLDLPLVPQGSGYVISTPPSGYATYTDC